MNFIIKLLILIIKPQAIFSVKGLRSFRNALYRKLYGAPKMFVSDRVTITTAHYNYSAYFRCIGQVNIGSDVYIDYSGGVEIHNRVAISEGAKIFTHNHTINDGSIDWMSNPIKFSPLTIENYVWIGASALVMPSVQRIEEGSIIAAGAVLTKDTEAFGIYAGNPARKIGDRRINDN